MTVPAGAVYIGGVACTPDGAVYVTPTGTAAITGGTSLWDNGAVGTPSIAFAAEPSTGFWHNGVGDISFSISGSRFYAFQSTAFFMLSNAAAIKMGATQDTTLSRQAAGLVCVDSGTATPAGGSASLGLVFGSTAGFGIYIGSGVPTLTAAQGSIYLRSDGSSTSTRLYVNTNGTTGWTNLTSAT